MNNEHDLRSIKQEMLRRRDTQRFKYYAPNAKIEEFIKTFGSMSTGFIHALIAANGVGKTTVIANIVANIVFPNSNPYFKYTLFTDFPYSIKAGRIVSDPQTVKETLIPELKKWLPAGRYTTMKNGKSYENKFIFDNGWTFDIMTFEQDLKEFESANLSVILLDEPPPYAIFTACVQRLRNGGKLGLLCTPINTNSPYLYDEFFANPDLKKLHRTLTTASMEDACKTHGVRGHLEHKNIELLISNTPKDELLPRIFGKMSRMQGLVFKEFSLEKHVIKPFPINRRDYVVIESLDVHPRNPDAMTWTAIDRYGRKIVVAELYVSLPTLELVERIKDIRSRFRIVKSLIDPSAFIEDQHKENQTENSLAKELAKYDLRFLPGSKRRQESTRKIRDCLMFKSTPGGKVQEPELYFFENCQRSIWEMSHWQWDEYTGATKERKGLSERPEDKNDHCIETIGRSLLEDIDFTEMTNNNIISSELNYDPY